MGWGEGHWHRGRSIYTLCNTRGFELTSIAALWLAGSTEAIHRWLMILRSIHILCALIILTGCVRTDSAPRNVTYDSDYELCLNNFNAFSRNGRNNKTYKHTLKEILNRDLNCEKFADKILMEKKVESLEARLKKAEKRASDAQERASDEVRRKSRCNILNNTRFYKRTGYTPPGC